MMQLVHNMKTKLELTEYVEENFEEQNKSQND